ncbi:NAD-dependent epimerase/dehydratase family protein [Clostridium saccharoperbutylacetonicum]
MNKIYLITGAAGFIGFHLSKQLLECGAKVIGYDNINAYYDVNLKYSRLGILKKYDNFKFYKANLEDKEVLINVFEEYKPNVVINLAAQAGVRYSIENPDVYIQSNIVGFANILECCRQYKIEHLLYASSSSVYGQNKKIPFSTEDTVDHPISLYAATKKSNELMAHTYSHLFDIPTTGLRFFTVYGEYGRPDMAYFGFTNKIIKGQPIQVFNNGDMKRDFTYIDDIIDGIIKLINGSKALELKPPYKIYNIGNNQPEKLMDFIETLEKYLGIKGEKQYLPMQAGDVPITYADVDELIKDVDFKPNTSIDKGLERFILWYKEYYNV